MSTDTYIRLMCWLIGVGASLMGLVFAVAVIGQALS